MMKLQTPLRACRVCGLKAYNEVDLELFKIGKKSSFGRDTLCKRCDRKKTKERKKNRQLKLIDVFKAKSFDGIIRCHFCGAGISKLSGIDSDSLIIHSLDGNHNNWKKENKVPTHRGCHVKHHCTGHHYNVGEKNASWKGDEASDGAKYSRGWRKRRATKP